MKRPLYTHRIFYISYRIATRGSPIEISDMNIVSLNTSCHTILEAASNRNEIAIGYKVLAEENDASKSYGININPPKSKMISLTPNDCIIVITEEG